MSLTKNVKNIPSPIFERASASGIKERGSITIEASIAIPMFLFAFLCLVYMMEIQSIKLSILNGAYSGARKASEATAVVPTLNVIQLKKDIVRFVGEDRIERSIIEGGVHGISCWKSFVSSETGEMQITVEYRVRLPVPFVGNPSAKIKTSFKTSAWRGQNGNQDGAGGDEIVYITENGIVYHESYDCPYLTPSLEYVSFESISWRRNKSGGKYKKCERCVYGTPLSGVYITDYGDRYHSSSECASLRRNIRAVKKSEIHGRGGCVKCTQ